MLNAKFYTKHLGHNAWKQFTKGMPAKVKQQAVAENLTTSLTYLHECSKRFEKLRPGQSTLHVPKFFQHYVKTSYPNPSLPTISPPLVLLFHFDIFLTPTIT
jgi:hypothetical protein